MVYDSLSLSQPLRSGAYNQHLLQKMQNKDSNQAVMPAMQQIHQNNSGHAGGSQQLMDSVSGFASELRSQGLVRAMAAVQQQGYSGQSSFGRTLQEQGADIDENGMITLPQSQANSEAIPENIRNAIALPQKSGINLNSKTSMALQGLKAMKLDDRSLGILTRVSQRGQNLFPQKSDPLQQKFTEIQEQFSLGSLSQKYESAAAGSQSIGYDRNGGTSYGTYQLSSRAGTFNRFVDFLKDKEPAWAEKLQNAGQANTGSRSGAVPTAWKELCAENPQRMKELEHDFIVESHYEPVMSYVQEKWQGSISAALQEVIFSTSVQHGVGGAKHIVDQALSGMQQNAMTQDNANTAEEELFMASFEEKASNKKNRLEEDKASQAEFIRNIYANRKNKFSSSTEFVQEAARNRFRLEEKDALAMLG